MEGTCASGQCLAPPEDAFLSIPFRASPSSMPLTPGVGQESGAGMSESIFLAFKNNENKVERI